MVKPEYRKTGIGKKLLKKAENSLKKEGIRKILIAYPIYIYNVWLHV